MVGQASFGHLAYRLKSSSVEVTYSIVLMFVWSAVIPDNGPESVDPKSVCKHFQALHIRRYSYHDLRATLVLLPSLLLVRCLEPYHCILVKRRDCDLSLVRKVVLVPDLILFGQYSPYVVCTNHTAVKGIFYMSGYVAAHLPLKYNVVSDENKMGTKSALLYCPCICKPN